MRKSEEWPLREKVIYDEEKGEIFFREQRFIILSARMLPVIHLEGLRIIGKVAHREVYRSCEKSGREYFKKLLETFPKNLGKEELVQRLFEFFTTWGIGKCEIISLDKSKQKIGIVRIHDCCYADFYEGIKEPVCYITAGLIAGMLSAVFKRRVEVVETKCKTAGYTFCEFQARFRGRK